MAQIDLTVLEPSKGWWAVAVAAVGAFLWVFRLGARMGRMEQQLDHQTMAIKNLTERIDTHLESLAK